MQRTDDAALVQQGQAADDSALRWIHEHHVGTAGIIFVEAERHLR